MEAKVRTTGATEGTDVDHRTYALGDARLRQNLPGLLVISERLPGSQQYFASFNVRLEFR